MSDNPYAASAARRRALLERETLTVEQIAARDTPPISAAPQPDRSATPPATNLAEPPAVLPTPTLAEEEEVRHQGVYIRAQDEERMDRVLAFMQANRRRLKSRRRGPTVIFRAGLELLAAQVEQDPDRALAVLARALPTGVGKTG